MNKQTLINLVLYLVPLILSLSVHEFAHAFVATKLGDDTPEREERLTLSPASHIDVFGTLLFPAMSIIFMGGAFFGWAKPVNINPSRFRRGVDMRKGMALASVAGPLSNLLLAVLSLGVLALATKMGWLAGFSPTERGVRTLLTAMFTLNVGLFVFNLLPIPPFDGSRLLPKSMDGVVAQLERYSFLVLMAILMIGPVRFVLIELPISLLQRALVSLFGFALPAGTTRLPC